MNINSTQLQIPNFPHKVTIQTHGEKDLVSQIILKDNIWEAYETELLINSLSEGDKVLDIGANIGYYSLIASKLVGTSGQVFAFEPETENFQLLKENIASNQLCNVSAFNKGLGDTQKTISFFTSEDNRGDHRAFNHEGKRQETSVDIMSGDQIAEDLNISLIKIDTQGYEYSILKGLLKTLKRNQNHVKVILEFWPFALKENNTSADALLEELARYPFKLQIIDHIKHELIDTDIQSLRELVKHSLTPESQGFINLWLSPQPLNPRL